MVITSPLSLARHTVVLLLARPSRSRIVALSGAREYVRSYRWPSRTSSRQSTAPVVVIRMKILAHTDTHPHQHGIILAFTHAACQRSDDGAMATWLSSQQLV